MIPAPGSIVWASISDANGVAKLRPCVVLAAEDPVPVVAVSTRLPDPLPADHVAIPWDPTGRSRTRLTRPCAAVCTWVELVPAVQIAEAKGVVPASVFAEILRKTTAPPNPPAKP